MPTELGFGLQPDEGAPKRGRRVRYSQSLDDAMQKLLQTPTPNACKAIWDRIDNGEYSELWSLAKEMERRDSQIRHVAESRRMSLTAIDWEILPNAEAEDEEAAQEAADYCNEKLRKIADFRYMIEHLVFSLTHGISAVEMMWENSEVVAIEPVPYTRLMGQPLGPQIYIKTDENPLGEPMPYRKFLIRSTCRMVPHAIGVSVVHAASKIFCMKCIVTQDWNTFMDVYAVPARIFKSMKLLEGQAKTNAEQMMQQLSSDLWALINGADEGDEIITLAPGTSSDVFEKAAAWCDDSLSKLYLMQTLTSDVRDSGSRSLGEVHQNTRADLLSKDMMNESDDIESGLLKPMCELRFPGRDMPTPWWRRKLIETKNIDADRLQIDKINLAMRLKLPMKTSWCYEVLDIEMPEVDLPDVIYPAEPENNPDENGDETGDDSQTDGEPQSNRERVMQAIERSWLSSKDIMQLTKLSQAEVKGVLTNRELRTKIRKRKGKGNSTEYRRVTKWH